MHRPPLTAMIGVICKIGAATNTMHQAPTKEGRALIPGTNLRPADVFIPHWAGGRDAALDVTVTHPLQDRTRAGAATTPGHALNVAYDRKVTGAGEQCRQQGIVARF